LADSGKRTIIIKTGEKIASLAPVAGDYEDWIAAGLSDTLPLISVVEVSRGDPLPSLDEVGAVAITGSGAMVTEQAEWMVQTTAWLREAFAAGVPILGICFGHQLLADALGGEVGDNPRGVEVGTATIRLSATGQHDPLFEGLPQQFPAQVSHRQSVLRLPPGARLLAASEREPHQAFAVGRCAWGLQFHPEFSAAVIRHFIEFYRDQLPVQGDAADALLAATAASPDSAGLLRRFAALARTCGVSR
jgi:GMP synthase (glutamine-hydrolysing)